MGMGPWGTHGVIWRHACGPMWTNVGQWATPAQSLYSWSFVSFSVVGVSFELCSLFLSCLRFSNVWSLFKVFSNIFVFCDWRPLSKPICAFLQPICNLLLKPIYHLFAPYVSPCCNEFVTILQPACSLFQNRHATFLPPMCNLFRKK